MSETFGFSLKLEDQVAGPAKSAADALRKVEEQSRRAQKALDFGAQAEKLEAKLHGIKVDPKGFEKVLKLQHEMTEQRKKAQEGLGIKKESFGAGIKESFGADKLLTGAFFGAALAEGAMKAVEILFEGIKKVVDFFTEGFKKAIEESSKEETLRLSYKLALGKDAGKEALENIEKFSKITQYTPDQTAKMMRPLYAAGMRGKGATTAFMTAADLAAVSGNKDSGSEYTDMMARIWNKGGVSSKQIAGMGLNTKKFYEYIAKAMHTSSAVAEKKANAGNGAVDPQLLLNALSDAVNQRQGGMAGSGAGMASNTMETRLEKLKNLPNEYLKKLVDSPYYEKLSTALGDVLAKLDPSSPTGAKIMDSLEKMFAKVLSWLDNVAKNDGLDKFAKGIQTAVEWLEKAVDAIARLVGWYVKAVDLSMRLAGGKSTAYDSKQDMMDKLAAQVKAGTISKEDANTVKEMYRGASFVDDDKPSAVSSPQSPETVAMRGSGQLLQFTLPKIEINVHPAKDDTNHTTQAFGEQVHRTVLNAADKALREAGG